HSNSRRNYRRAHARGRTSSSRAGPGEIWVHENRPQQCNRDGHTAAAGYRPRHRAWGLVKGAALSPVWAGCGRLARWGRDAQGRYRTKQGRVAPGANARRELALGKRVQQLAELPPRIGPPQNGGASLVRQPIEGGAT